MISNLSPFLTGAAYLAMALIFAGMILSFIRLVKGPTLADRVVAIDLFTMYASGLIIVYSFLTGLRYYLDAVFVLALIAFIGTVAFARYLEKRALK